jgi:hypothetical protein
MREKVRQRVCLQQRIFVERLEVGQLILELLVDHDGFLRELFSRQLNEEIEQSRIPSSRAVQIRLYYIFSRIVLYSYCIEASDDHIYSIDIYNILYSDHIHI